uniref:Acyltransferase 3 domain-containing protein n=1 Tax=Phaeomonas parva TaxID=124430 RepID=A0A7S1U4U0_9STRA|mmetsp:Transcript_31802/g.101150  ORF Transcript_31802/g.101150 Transcript_31802/m.101150 type:complete len:1342 (+) Transcript_31802:253-4278(+)
MLATTPTRCAPRRRRLKVTSMAARHGRKPTGWAAIACCLAGLLASASAEAGLAAASCSLPRCRGTGVSPAGTGHFDGTNFIDDGALGAGADQCAYHFYKGDEVIERFAGGWMFIQGASVTQCMHQAILQELMPGAPDFDGHEFFDIGFSVETKEVLWMQKDRCHPPHNKKRCKTLRGPAFERVVENPESVFRLTFARTRIADDFPVMNQFFLDAPWGGWRGIYLQTNVQYIYCWRMKGFCRFRADLKESIMSEEDMLMAHEMHWRKVLEEARASYCKRKDVVCMVATADYFSKRAPYHELMAKMNSNLARVVEETRGDGEEVIQLLDAYAVSHAARNEIMNGHPSHLVNTWQYQRMFHALEAAARDKGIDVHDQKVKQLVAQDPEFSNVCAAQVTFDDQCFKASCTSDEYCKGGNGFDRMVSRRCLWSAEPSSGAEGQQQHLQLTVEDDDKEKEAEPASAPWTLHHTLSFLLCAALVVMEGREVYLKAQKAKEKASLQRGKPDNRLRGLGFARYLASLHVALTHLSRQGHMPRWLLLNFGFTWVPWFFMLSGFVLTYGKLAKEPSKKNDEIRTVTDHETGLRKEDAANGAGKGVVAVKGKRGGEASTGTFIYQRLTGVYPLYIVVLVAVYIEKGYSLRYFPIQALLMQSWFPSITEKLPQLHCWFLSALVPFWLLFQPTYDFLKRKSDAFLARVAAGCFLLGLLPTIPGDWFAGHRGGRSICAADILVVLMKFSPYFYFHVFVFGMVLGVFLHRQRKQSAQQGDGRKGPFVARYGATIGYIGLIILFTTKALLPPGYKLSFRMGAMAPLQGLILVGLGMREDPLCKLFYLPLLDGLGGYSYAQYLLQFQVYRFWNRPSDVCFPIVLLGCSILGTKYVIQPAGRYLKKNQPKRFPGPSAAQVLFLLLGASYLYLHPLRLSAPAVLGIARADYTSVEKAILQPYTRGFGYEDKTLQLEAGTGALGDCQMINPSVLEHNGRMLVAARCLALSHESSCGMFEYQSTNTWASEVYLGYLPLDGADDADAATKLRRLPVVDAESKAAWTPCQRPAMHFPANQSVVYHRVHGLEDPRLLIRGAGSELVLTGVSRPHGEAECYDEQQTFMGKFRLTPDLEVALMNGEVDGSDLPAMALTKFNADADGHGPEKNIGLFNYYGQDYAVYNLLPFQVWRSNEPKEGWSQVFEEERPAPFDAIRMVAERLSVKPVEFHGGSNPVLLPRRVVGGAAQPEREVLFVGVGHTLGYAADGSRRYLNFLYAFAAGPKFEVLGASRPLPLGLSPTGDSDPLYPRTSGEWVDEWADSQCAFASGLTVQGESLYIGYGICDEGAGLFKVNLSQLPLLFSWR